MCGSQYGVASAKAHVTNTFGSTVTGIEVTVGTRARQRHNSLKRMRVATGRAPGMQQGFGTTHQPTPGHHTLRPNWLMVID